MSVLHVLPIIHTPGDGPEVWKYRRWTVGDRETLATRSAKIMASCIPASTTPSWSRYAEKGNIEEISTNCSDPKGLCIKQRDTGGSDLYATRPSSDCTVFIGEYCSRRSHLDRSDIAVRRPRSHHAPHSSERQRHAHSTIEQGMSPIWPSSAFRLCL